MKELLGQVGFFEVGVHACLHPFLFVFFESKCSNAHNGGAAVRFLLTLPYGARGFKSVHDRHLNIHQNHIPSLLFKKSQRFNSVSCRLVSHAPTGQQLLHIHQVYSVVFDAQHAQATNGFLMALSRRCLRNFGVLDLELKGEGAPLVQLTGCRNASPMQGAELPAYGQAQSTPLL